MVLRDDGDFIPGQCEAGNRIAVVQLQPHPRFKRKGLDLQTDVKISLLHSLTGGAPVAVEHLDGRWLSCATPIGAVVPHDKVMMIPGEGMPVRGNPFEKGDLYLQFKVEFPPAGHFEDPDVCAALRSVLPSGAGAGRDGSAAVSDELAGLDLEAEDVESCVMKDADLSQLGKGTLGRGGVEEEEEEGEAGGGGGVQCAQQ